MMTNNESFDLLLRKYALIAIFTIVFPDLYYRLGFPFALDSIFQFIHPYGINLFVAMLIFKDMEKNDKVSWPVLALTALSSYVGITFFIIMTLHEKFLSNSSSKD